MVLKSSVSQHAFLKKHGCPLMVIGSPINDNRLLVYQKESKSRGFGFQRKSIQPRYQSVLTKGLSLIDNLQTATMLPPEHDIIRSSKKKDYLLLENKGLISATAKFNIADRKSKGVVSKKRQLSVLYKIELNYFKKILNAYLDDGLNLPLEKGALLELENIQQFIKGSINNVPLEIVVTPIDFFDNSPNAPPISEQEVPGSITDDYGEGYIKVILHKFVRAYNLKVGSAVLGNPLPDGTISTSISTDIVFNEGIKPSSNIIRGQNYNPQSIGDSSGIFALEPGSAIFREPPTQISSNPSPGDIVGEDQDGRTLFSDEPDVVPFPIKGITSEGIPYHFNAFTKLPLDVRFIELNNFQCSIRAAGIERNIADRVSNIARSILNLNSQTPSETPLVFDSDSEFLLPLGFYKAACNTEIGNRKPEEHVLSIESRKTIYTVKTGSSNESKKLTENPFIFEYFENERRYERAYVSLDYLGASLHYALISNIRKTHSNSIVYNTIRFNVFAGKDWSQGNGSITKKNPLQAIDTKEAKFVPMVTGTNPSEVINQNTNLIFTAQFAQSTQNIYFTNRFITCSAFSNQSELTTRDAKELWANLEKGFSEDIILSYYPLVRLIPAYTRGSIIQTSNEIYFRGAVSNSGSGETFPI
uniref:Putative encoded protein n=1 Tax=Dunaliella salina TaxID=3046 RepID=A0A1C8XRS1_DUNSA|nr:putative encoded protein [Dunaliella salina]